MRVPIVDGRLVPIKPVAVVSNGGGRTTPNPLLDGSNLLWRGGLLENVRNTGAIISFDVVWCALTAEVTVCALGIDVILAGNVQRVSLCEFSHAGKDSTILDIYARTAESATFLFD
jgi:hypothetical protein